MGLASPFRVKCKNCPRFLPENNADLYLGRCVYCWESRLKGFSADKFSLEGNVRFQRCFECHRLLIDPYWTVWDNLAAGFKLVCIPCGDKQFNTDPQYKNTNWGWKRKFR